MDPPIRPSRFRQSTSMQVTRHSPSRRPTSKTPTLRHTPNPDLTPQRDPLDGYMTPEQPAEYTWPKSDDLISQHTTTLQVELAECVETKTVTTTTTTTRTYPPLLIKPPHRLTSLDAKEYPLAFKPTPPGLTDFSYEVGGEVVHLREANSNATPHQPQSLKDGKDSVIEEAGRGDRWGYETPNSSSKSYSQHTEGAPANLSTTKLMQAPRSPDSVGKLPPPIQRRMSSRTRSYLYEPRPLQAQIHRLNEAAQDLYKSTASNDTSTSEASDLDSSVNKSQPNLSFATSSSDSSFDEAASLAGALPSSFPSAVATPPIADADLERFVEPFERVSEALRGPPTPRLSLNTSATTNASLPSPSLSPTLAAANMQNGVFPLPDEQESEIVEGLSGSPQSSATHKQYHDVAGPQSTNGSRKLSVDSRTQVSYGQKPNTIMDTHSMLDTFDAMPTEMKTFMMYQFLRRCPRKTLHVVAKVVNPALKCDFLEELPPELSLHILSFLGHKDLCRAAQVSKRWRNIIDSNETGWKELLDRDEFVLPPGELERAITQGWGWQDPYGADGWERDLSATSTSLVGEASNSLAMRAFSDPTTPVLRNSMKRKRALGSLGVDRSKKRALLMESKEKLRSLDSKSHAVGVKHHETDGPNAAATAAALAVADPELGLPSLRKLHLYKSLYRRHYMLQRSWMSGKVQPHHMAFPAHPRHVITCLQFDDDKILTGSDDTYIHVYDTKTGALRKRLEGHEGGVWALQYEGNVLVSGSTDRSVRVWDIEKGLCTQVFHGHTSTVRCLQILMPVNTGKTANGNPIMVPEKPLIITGSRDSQLRVWKLPEQGAKRYIQTGPPANDTDCPYFIRTLQGHTHSVRAIAAHQDTLVSGSYDSTVRVWKISTGETLHQLRGHGQKVYSVVLDHERRRCISGSMDNTVKIWSLDTGACLYTLEGHSSLVGLLDLRDGRLVSAAADSTLRIWDPENGQCKSTLTAHTGAITCFQHDGTKVISGSDRTLKMWNVKTGECVQDLLTDLSGVWQVKFDERRCVAAVQRDSLTFIEVLDFGASRDGIPPSERGRRILLPPSDADRITDDDDFVG